jgi:hypothetical protein
MALNLGESFRGARGALTAIALAGASSILGAFPAAAQQAAAPYTSQQCDAIRNNVLGIFKRYDGKISAELVADLQEFSKKDCDRTVRVRMIPGTRDSDAVGELKVLMAARLSSIDRPAPR